MWDSDGKAFPENTIISDDHKLKMKSNNENVYVTAEHGTLTINLREI